MTALQSLRRSRRFRVAAAFAAVLLGCTLLTACWPFHGPATIHVKAKVSDVADMAGGAPVEMSDLPVGSVSKIALDSTKTQALLTLSIKKSAHVPADVNLRVRRTTPLGEKFVDLEPRDRSAPRPYLADGAYLHNTPQHPRRVVAVPDVEDLVKNGTDLFGALSASQIQVLVQEGANALRGNGSRFHDLLARLSDITSGYATRTGRITDLVNDIDKLSSDLAPNSVANAQMFTNLAQTTQILSDQSNNFLDLIDSLNKLAGQTTSLIKTHFQHITDQITGLQVFTNTVAGQQRALGNILRYLPGHNAALASGAPGDWLQVVLAVVLCGAGPIGGDIPGDPVNSCRYVPQAPVGN